MENMHLFTSLLILFLAISINSRQPRTFHQNPDEAASLYEAGKDVLRYNMHSGSLAAKGHLDTLKDIEELGSAITRDDGVGVNHEGWQAEVDEWVAQLIESENMPCFPES